MNTDITNQSLTLAALGDFAPPLPVLITHVLSLDGMNVDLRFHDDLLSFNTSPLSRTSILLTDISWLSRLPSAEQVKVAQCASTVAGWFLLTESDTPLSDLFTWQRAGVTDFCHKPIDLEWLTSLIADVHERLAGPPIRVVLFCEDDQERRYHHDVLQQNGISALAVVDPEQALQAINDFKPDLLLVGALTPGCRGAELIAVVRRHPEHSHLPISVLVGVNDEILSSPACEASFSHYLVNPVVPNLLVPSVRSQALHLRSLRRASIRQSRRADDAKRQLEQMRAAVDEHAIVTITDVRGVIVYANKHFCMLSGYSEQELLGQTHRLVKSDQHSLAFYRNLWRTISSGQIWQGEICNRHKSGAHYWVEATIVPFLNDAGKPQQYIAIRTDITELINREVSLSVSEERLKRAQIFANIGTWDWSIDTGELYWSERIAPLFGYPSGTLETSYDNFLGAVHPDDRQAVIDAVTASVEHDASYDIEHRVVWPDGQVRWLLEKGAVTRDDMGRPLHMLGVVQDIHERKMTEIALAQSEKRLREAQTLAQIGDWQADIPSGQLIWSDEIFHIFGHAPQTFSPTVAAFKAMVHPDDQLLVAKSEGQAAISGTHDVIHRIVRPDGTIRHVHERARAERNAAGEMIRLLGTVQDITERVEAENRLKDSELQFTFAVEGAGDGIWDWNLLTGEMLFSGHYEEMLGYAKGELQPTVDTWVESVHPDDLPRVRQNLQDYLAGKYPIYEVELRLRSRQGGFIWILCRGTVVARDHADNPIRMIGIHSDISTRKKIESQLINASEEATRANRAKSDFLSSMSHELRTPMNAIIGFGQMLEYDAALNVDQQDNVHEILKGARHLLKLINEILDLSRIESGHIDLSLERVDIHNLVDECRQLLQPLANERQIAFHESRLGDGLGVRADRVRLKQVLLNLISNAIKYNRLAGEVRVSAIENGADQLRINITDTGVGIPEDRMTELFKPFSRLGMDQTDIEGTGVGLSITRRLVELMGGRIGVDSEVDVGSTFWIELPREDIVAADGERANANDTTAVALTDGRVFHVLSIDDNPANLKLIAQILGMRKHIHLMTAHTPTLGIALARAQPQDLILLDINMPEMDGYQVLKVIKADASLANIPVIAITANAMPRDIERGIAAGFDAYLTKPIDIDAFLSTLDLYRLNNRTDERTPE